MLCISIFDLSILNLKKYFPREISSYPNCSLSCAYGQYDVLITNNISEGNSGGPLIDNEGLVVGIVTWGSDNDREQFKGARSLDTFCVKMIKCDFEYDGEKVWYDYEEWECLGS